MDVNHANLKDLFAQFSKAFGEGLTVPPPVDYTRFTEVVPSSTSRNIYAWLGDIPKFRKWVGERIVNQLKSDKYELPNVEFEDSFSVKRAEIRDDQYGVYRTRSTLMGKAAARWPYEQVADLLVNISDVDCYDGQGFIDTDHPVGSSTVSNDRGGSAVDPYFMLDLNSLIKPFIWQVREAPKMEELTEGSEGAFYRAEYVYGAHASGAAGVGFWQTCSRSRLAITEDNLRAQRLAMRQLKSPEGKSLGINPGVILCGPSNADALEKILKRDIAAEGGVAVSNTMKGAFELIILPELG